MRRYWSERADREIAQPEVGEAALFPKLKQRPVQALSQEIVAALDRNADALAEEPALQKRTAAESAAARRIGAVEPKSECDAIVEQKVDFLSTQTFNVNPNIGADVQNAVQTSTVDSQTTTRQGFLVETVSEHVSYPLTVDFSFTPNSDGTFTQATTVNQQNQQTDTKALNGFPLFESNTQEQVLSTDTLSINAAQEITAAVGNSSASFQSNDSLGNCFSRSLTAENQVLTSVTNGKGCEQQKRFPF